MDRRRLWLTMLVFVGAVVALLAVNVGLGRTPVLGLDLQGGVSVILSPEGGASGGDLVTIRDLIRDELEGSGIAEPDVRVEGSNILVDLPGVKDQAQALESVNVAGIVTFRPVVGCLSPEQVAASDAAATSTTATTVPAASTPAASPPGSDAPATSAPEATTPSSAAATATAVTGGFARPATATTDPAPTEGTAPVDGTAAETTPPGGTTASSDAAASTVPAEPTTTINVFAPTTTINIFSPTTTTTPPPQLDTLPTRDGGQCQVGPSGGTGELFKRDSAQVAIDQGWAVNVSFTSTGGEVWNQLAAQCFNRLSPCDSGQMAIVLDDVIQSAPVVNDAYYDPSRGVSITGNNEDQARSLARVLNRGAFPVNVTAQSVQTVSPTLGSDSLRAAIVAGLVGVALVLVVFGFFYRSLTPVILAGMIVWGMLIYSVATFISETTNFALTLAGATGIIISIGVTVDSYVVYFERLKDEVRHGRTLRNSATRAFRATWRTVLAADLVSLLGAVVLFLLSVGSVRGFALYLGVTTFCDILVFYFFTRPSVILLAGSGWLDRRGLFANEKS